MPAPIIDDIDSFIQTSIHTYIHRHLIPGFSCGAFVAVAAAVVVSGTYIHTSPIKKYHDSMHCYHTSSPIYVCMYVGRYVSILACRYFMYISTCVRTYVHSIRNIPA